jgi:hypothetical protein
MKYSVLPVDFGQFEGQFDPLSIPPDRVKADCPSLMYPSPTESRVFFLWGRRNVLEELRSLLDVIVQDFRDVLALYRTSRVSAVETSAVAHVCR